MCKCYRTAQIVKKQISAILGNAEHHQNTCSANSTKQMGQERKKPTVNRPLLPQDKYLFKKVAEEEKEMGKNHTETKCQLRGWFCSQPLRTKKAQDVHLLPSLSQLRPRYNAYSHKQIHFLPILQGSCEQNLGNNNAKANVAHREPTPQTLPRLCLLASLTPPPMVHISHLFHAY